MKSEQLAEYAKLVEGPGNCGEHRDAIAALLAYTHDLECRVEILKDQADAKNDLRAELSKSDLQVDAAQKRLKQIAESEDTARLTAEQTLMGYNAHKDLARAALIEMQYPQKPKEEPPTISIRAGGMPLSIEKRL